MNKSKLGLCLISICAHWVLTPDVNAQNLTADTNCLNEAVSFAAPEGRTYYNWNFNNEGPDLNLTSLPVEVNIMQGGALSNPSYITMSKDGENYYSFVVNYYSNQLIRLDYGTSPLNTPLSVNLGTFGSGGQFASHSVLYDDVNHEWFIVAVANTQLITLSFGNSLTNIPTAVINNFPTNFAWPHQMGMRKIGNEWIAFVANRNGQLTRLNFGANITNTPVAVNLPLSNYNNPSYFALHEQDGEWYMLVESLIDPSRMARLSFGSDINNNAPLVTDLGDFEGKLSIPRGVVLFADCVQGELFGYALNSDGQMLKLNFNGDITNTPDVSSLGFFSTGSADAGLITFTYNKVVYSMKVRFGDDAVDRMVMFNYPTSTISEYGNNTQSKLYANEGTYNVSVNIDAGDIMGTKSICNSFTVDSCNTTTINDLNANNSNFLYQNTPNPVFESTTIHYSVKEIKNNASIIIFDPSGKQIITKYIAKSGEGSVIIDQNMLTGGIYFYRLVVDGRTSKTFKMIISK